MGVERFEFVHAKQTALHTRAHFAAKQHATPSGPPALGRTTDIPSGGFPSRWYAPDRVHHPGSRERSVESVRSSPQGSLPTPTLRDTRSWVRARASRDITVPNDTEVTSAISL